MKRRDIEPARPGRYIRESIMELVQLRHPKGPPPVEESTLDCYTANDE